MAKLWPSRGPAAAVALAVAAAIVGFMVLGLGGAPSPRPQHWAEAIGERAGLQNLYRVADGLYRGAQPKQQGFASLRAMGIKTVIDLRAGHDETEQCETHALDYVRIPMRAWKYDDEDVIRFLRIVQRSESRPVFVHCRRGADRTGMVIAVYRVVLEGWSKQDAVREMRKGGYGFNPFWFNLADYVRDLDFERFRAAVAAEAEEDRSRSPSRSAGRGASRLVR